MLQLTATKEPVILQEFVKNITAIMWKSEEKTSGWGWFKTTYTVKSLVEDYDKSKVNNLIREYIEQLRIDAAKAVYNSALRDKETLTKKRVDQIRSCLDEEDNQHNKEFKNVKQLESQ